MTIARHSGRMQLVCDCDVAGKRTYARDEFDVMIGDARDEGWAIWKEAGEWQHACPDCAGIAARRSNRGSLL